MLFLLDQVMAETIGMGLLPEEAARELAEEATYRYFQVFVVKGKGMFFPGFASWYRTVRSSCTTERGTSWWPRMLTRPSG